METMTNERCDEFGNILHSGSNDTEDGSSRYFCRYISLITWKYTEEGNILSHLTEQPEFSNTYQ